MLTFVLSAAAGIVTVAVGEAFVLPAETVPPEDPTVDETAEAKVAVSLRACPPWAAVWALPARSYIAVSLAESTTRVSFPVALESRSVPLRVNTQTL